MHARWRLLLPALLWPLTALWPLAAPAADAPPLVLEHLTAAEGMPQGTVYDTLQDSQGFVWLATEDGLVRYDGHDLVRYGYSRNAVDGLPGNFVRQIVEDAHHDLWIAIKDAGLARWNRATDSFTRYRHDPENSASLASDVARAVVVDTHGRIWIATNDAGVDVLDPSSGAIEHRRHDPANPDSLSDDQTFTLYLDRSGSVWVGTAKGLDRWQPERNAFAHFRRQSDDPRSPSGLQVSAIIEDHRGDYWIGTFDGGVERMDPSGHVLERFRHDAHAPASLASDDVRALLEDRAGHLWIGTPEGLELLDSASGRFQHYRHDDRDPSSLPDSYIMSLYEGSEGLVWIGTRGGGVSRWNPRSWELGGRRPDWLAGRYVTAFADAPNHKVWIASLGGLALLDEGSGEIVDVDAAAHRKEALGDRRVMALHLDRHDTLWIGTMANGLKKLSADRGLESFPVKADDRHSLSAAGIQTIFEARDGEIWLGMHDGGVNILDPASGMIRQLPYNSSSRDAISAASVTAIAEDGQGDMWIGTDDGGLDLAGADGRVRRVFRHDPADPASLPSNTVYALEVDAKGRLWVATDGGLAQMLGTPALPQAVRFKVMSREDGLSSDAIYGMLTDSNGRLWLSSDAGLMRFDPATGTIKTYHREQGLLGEEFDSGAYHRLRDGRLCFGGPGWFNIFDPTRVTENTRAPRVALTNLEVLGVPVASRTPYWLLDRLSVGYRASIVSLDFGALDFVSPRHNRLAYRVAKLSDRWIDLGTQHRVTLTNLDAGDHLLEVRAANADGVWSEPLKLTVHRDAAPWRSWWAYASYALVLLLLIAQRIRAHRAKIRGIVEAKQRLESEVAMRTRELVESNRQLAEAAQAKSNFLARMSHELRTPMNGVVGMTELLGRTALSAAQARLTRTIRSSAEILLQIVNDLLDLSKIQAGKVEFESLPLDLQVILEECTALFAAAAESKGIELIVCPPPEEGALLGDPLRIRQIVLNLVGNAVKFTLRGEVVVKADIERGEPNRATLKIAVSDTGVGMDAATVDKVFEPFTQADESTTRRFGGTGLGLAICRELAALMGGTVTVESRLNVGSTFQLCVPLRTGAVQAAGPPVPFTARAVRVLTRRPALADSIARQVAALGLTAVCDARDHGVDALAGEELLVADLSTHAAMVEAAVRDGRTSRLVIVGSSAELEALDRSRIDLERIVSKPVHREALRAALRRAAGVATEHPAVAASSDRVGGHVLLVEDEPVNAAVAQGYLEELGCTSVWVDSGRDAVARSATERFDIIMMDLNMPAMDGFATTRLIREREGGTSPVPIIALTAHEASSYRAACLAAGMNDVMSKPYTLDQCAQLLRRFIPRSCQRPNRVQSNSDVSPEVHDAGASGSAAQIDAPTVMGLKNLRSLGQPDLYMKLVALFQPACARALQDLDATVGAGNFGAASSVCHKLASSAANVGALVFARHVRDLEQACRQRDAAHAARLFETIRAAYPVLMDELARMQLRESA